ncbi:MAG: PepSY domain-containing protein [Rhodospirillaceae bacterium]|nr:PepSY domain-containing protein [Rhodospirillaceae bacterium]
MATAPAPAPGGAGAPARAHEKGKHDPDADHERARAAVERGEALPLDRILAAVRPHIDGEIVETGFEREHGVWTYEIKYIDRAGRMREIHVDARTAEILEHEDEP